jgi:hypothetical protein
MKLNAQYLLLFVLLLVSKVVSANDNTLEVKKVNDLTNDQRYEQVVNDYKKYLSTVDKSVIKEIEEFRKKVSELNKEKQSMYKKLSQQAQQHLSIEKEFKRKLPIKNRAVIKKITNNPSAE